MEQVFEFLRKYAHLDGNGSPDYRGQPDPGYTNPIERIHPHMRHDFSSLLDVHPPTSPARTGEQVFEDDYKKISIPEILEQDFERMPRQRIPDSVDCILIDIGSHLGRRITRPFAKLKPNVQVVLVDKITKEDFENDSSTFKAYPRNDIAGTELTQMVEMTDDMQDSINRLLQANGYHNVRYVQKELTGDNYDLGIDCTRKKVIVTGFYNPCGLGNSTAQLAIDLGAQELFLSNSALEKEKRKYGRLMAQYLFNYMSVEETMKLNKLMNTRLTRDKDSLRFENDRQRMMSYAIYLPFVLAQANLLEKNGYAVDIYQIRNNSGYVSYNNPRHAIHAVKMATIEMKEGKIIKT